ncbi:hypothetical protein [Halalkalibacterium ligniniphilum]|uniref:hypothetical protein n=1 Tax=Halalkalibacterium ligniniphilum TaxID=1134413 RepID=UPI000348EAB6|nr:hypothetical protein [Halalkalibacterium ligniniphilum]
MWLLFIVTLLLLFSVLLKRTSAVAALGLLTVMGLSVTASLFQKPIAWSPGVLGGYAHRTIAQLSTDGILGAIFITTLTIVLLLSSGVLYLRRREWLSGG